MTVEMWFTDTMDTERIQGDLLSVTTNLNIAASNGKQFAILDGVNGPVMVQTRLITKAKEVEDAFIGS